ncbi:MAG: prepilin-type N-terminal cleavage/methylation domain-containing protein [Glaciimonas sp.]|nr:prepilin-type N-terminal cleavage/methylation domain-containing protein [Glaciimonas sp.]
MTTPTKIAGFTLIELIMVMVIIGVLAVAAMPRFMDRKTFETRGFHDQTKSMLRYAQKTAIAQRRFVCVAFTSSSITLTIDAINNAATATCPGTALASADGKLTSVVTAPSGITFSQTPADFSFGALGRPGFNTQQSISVVDVASAILIESETGYVH